jgi:hypothetical protein
MPEKNQRPTANIDAAWMKSDLAGVERALNEYASEDDMVVSLRVENAHTHPVTFTLEPWAEEVIMPPRSSVWVFACGPKVSKPHDKLHVECGDERITVYGWIGCLAYVVAVEEGNG